MIPKCLSQDHLPSSFRFYDPVLKIVKRNMDAQKREYYSLKLQLAQEQANRVSFQQVMKSVLGPDPDKLVVKQKRSYSYCPSSHHFSGL